MLLDVTSHDRGIALHINVARSRDFVHAPFAYSDDARLHAFERGVVRPATSRQWAIMPILNYDVGRASDQYVLLQILAYILLVMKAAFDT